MSTGAYVLNFNKCEACGKKLFLATKDRSTVTEDDSQDENNMEETIIYKRKIYT
jgi:hypothetical protein